MLYVVTLGPLQLIEISLWLIVIVLLAIVGILFLKDYRRSDNKYFLWISFFFFLFILARILRLLVKFYFGEPVIPGDPLVGEAFILESIYTIVSYIGLFFIYYAMESKTIKKTHYFFSILVWVVTAVSIIDFVVRELLYITLPLFLLLVLALPTIFLILAIKSSGQVRTNALYVFIGILLFILGIAMDIPDGKMVFYTLPIEILAIVPPMAQIISFYFLRKGFSTKM